MQDLKELLIKFLESMDFPMNHIEEFTTALKNEWVKSRSSLFATTILNNKMEQILGLLEDIEKNGGKL